MWIDGQVGPVGISRLAGQLSQLPGAKGKDLAGAEQDCRMVRPSCHVDDMNVPITCTLALKCDWLGISASILGIGTQPQGRYGTVHPALGKCSASPRIQRAGLRTDG